MALNDIYFEKQNGGMARRAESDDPVSALLFGLEMSMSPNDAIYKDFISLKGGLYVKKLKYVEELEALGIVNTPATVGVELTDREMTLNFIHYHCKEFFKYSPKGTLYLAIEPNVLTGENLYRLQRYANGIIRQAGIASPSVDGASIDALVTEYNDVANRLSEEHMPLSVIIGLDGKVCGSLKELQESTAYKKNAPAVSLCIAKDLDAQLMEEQMTHGFADIAAVGTIVGCVSAASVHESVSWVGKFPVEVSVPGIVTGDALKDLKAYDLDLLDDARMIFYRTHVGVQNVYFNNSHTMTEPTSDYAYIENVRTMDKAVRGIRANLLPYLGSPLKVDATTGYLSADTVAVLETVAGCALEDMERLGELSGYKVEIDREQNVLSTSSLEIVIKNVPLGVMRRVTVKIGFTQKID
ncbi:MAG: hypothetical protein IJW01_07670 [Paludibacteraceae bacterium]|nr:hypothetical protein [Paludibacteraceae bacterium]